MWLQKLEETYDRCVDGEASTGTPMIPVGHTEQQTHLEITLSAGGEFRGAVILKRETIAIPTTEASAGRTSGPSAHPLVDKLQYVAADYPALGGTKRSYHDLYLRELRAWMAALPNAKVNAVLRYVEHGSVIADLVREGLIRCDINGKLMDVWPAQYGPAPAIFTTLTEKNGKRDVGDAFVRWTVVIPGMGPSALWQDEEVQHSWLRFISNGGGRKALCMVSGKVVTSASSHPKRLRHGADRAKLISSNDSLGYTFRGRFESEEQAYSLGYTTSHKGHTALRWLIARQGYQQGDQAIIAWAVGGQTVPALIASSNDLIYMDQLAFQENDSEQAFVRRLDLCLSRYAAQLSDRDEIIIMALDSATRGRIAITYYRELSGSEYLRRIHDWHRSNAWIQNLGKGRRFIGSPTPQDIAEAAFGPLADEKMRKFGVERLLPSLIEGLAIPKDLVEACVRRATNRSGQQQWEWERVLGVACALLHGSKTEEHYTMSLEEMRTTRGYLFGRLLAVAEKVESYTLYLQSRRYQTTAAERLMQRFADHPMATWRTIELALLPSMAWLQTNEIGASYDWKQLLDEIAAKFQLNDFERTGRLEAEFLLGYHCQRSALKEGRVSDRSNDPRETSGDCTTT